MFPNKEGGLLNPRTVQCRFYKITEQAGVRRISFHGLRKTCFRMLVENGVSLININGLHGSSLHSVLRLNDEYMKYNKAKNKGGKFGNGEKKQTF